MTREEAIQVLNMVEAHGSLVIQAKEMAIKALSAEGEYIKKEDIINECISYADHENNVKFKKEVSERRKHDAEVIIYACEHFRKFVNGLPTYSFPDREKGEWIATENEEMEVDGYFCSKCDSPMPTDEKTSFCPFCGADMRRDKADE